MDTQLFEFFWYDTKDSSKGSLIIYEVSLSAAKAKFTRENPTKEITWINVF